MDNEEKQEKEDLFKGYGVKITLKKDDDFLKIKETLTRIGVTARNENTLYQTVHILHKRGEYAIVHFKELFAFDGKVPDLSDEDIARRNTIVKLLAEWKLLDIVDAVWFNALPKLEMSKIKIIPFKEKSNWTLVEKYKIGKKNG